MALNRTGSQGLLSAQDNAEQTPSYRVTVSYDSNTRTTRIQIRDLDLYKSTKREFWWTIALLIIAIGFITFDVVSGEEHDTSTISILILLITIAFCSLVNFLSLVVYYAGVIPNIQKTCQIIVSKHENDVQLSGYGFANKFFCGCLFGRLIPLETVTLKNAFIQYRSKHSSKQFGSDALWCYIRGCDEMLNANDARNQLDVEEEIQTLCHQKWNIATSNILKDVITYKERRWLILTLIKSSHCAILSSVDNDSDEFSLQLPSDDDRIQMIDL